jgi:hypothetical protein
LRDQRRTAVAGASRAADVELDVNIVAKALQKEKQMATNHALFQNWRTRAAEQSV